MSSAYKFRFVTHSNLVRHSTARVIAAIASVEVPLDQWNDLLPFLEQTCRSPNVTHREVAIYILYTVLENIVDGFENEVIQLFALFEVLVADPESLEVRVTTVRALGVVAQYIELNDKDEIVSLPSRSQLHRLIFSQKAFQQLLPSMINVIGQCVEAANETGARQLFDVFETLLILVCTILSPRVWSRI